MPDDIAPIAAANRSVAALAIRGLTQEQKTLPAKLFYDEEGCRLFRQITELPEYYLTRTEASLLADIAPEVAKAMPTGSVLVEYGASDETKAGYLLHQRNRSANPVFSDYVPIDMAAPELQQMRSRLMRAHPALRVHLLAADFTGPIELPADLPLSERLGFFPGSTIGNLDPPEAIRFLRQARETLGSNAHFLVGVDRTKDPAILLAAYDDAAGVTAAFNRNILVRLNREADADFDPDAFVHRAVWNDQESRIEMHLASRSEQAVQLAGRIVHFARGETIHTENSYKYTPERFAALAEQSSWGVSTMWTDPASLFALYLLGSTTG